MIRLLDRAIEVVLGLLLAALIVTAGGQVIARYLFLQSFSWVLELDVLLLVWATMLSGYLGVRRNLHMAVDFGVAQLGAQLRKLATLASLALSALFCAVFGWTSFTVIDAMEGIPFTSLAVGQPWLYWSLPAGAALMLFALAVEFFARLKTPA